MAPPIGHSCGDRTDTALKAPVGPDLVDGDTTVVQDLDARRLQCLALAEPGGEAEFRRWYAATLDEELARGVRGSRSRVVGGAGCGQPPVAGTVGTANQGRDGDAI